jgi:hypothetical protein
MANDETLEGVLSRYPGFEKELRPMLEASLALRRFEDVAASAEFKRRSKTALQAHMRAHPRTAIAVRRPAVFRYAVGFAMLLLAFTTTGTALAQSALPGQALYSWKLASERVWRRVHVNRVYVDLELSSRRLHELIAVQGDPERAAEALQAYAASLEVLQNDVKLAPKNALSARNVISAHKEAVRSLLSGRGEDPEEFFTILPTLDEVIEKNPDQNEPATTPDMQIPIITVIPPLGGKHEDDDDQGGGSSASEDNEAGPSLGETINGAIDELLGLP